MFERSAWPAAPPGVRSIDGHVGPRVAVRHDYYALQTGTHLWYLHADSGRAVEAGQLRARFDANSSPRARFQQGALIVTVLAGKESTPPPLIEKRSLPSDNFGPAGPRAP
jgi:hypothetical protein